MARDYRPGDRSRREDDRYLFLEALLSARDELYISWVGRSVRDNTERPPSVLVNQLRDHLAAGWRLADARGGRLQDALTVEHPLQPFSRANFPGDGRGPLFTYAREWAGFYQTPARGPASGPLEQRDPEGPLSPEDLGGFLKNPVQTFFNRRLGVYFDDANPAPEDQEPFGLDSLAQWQVRERLVAAALDAPEGGGDREGRLDETLAGLRRSGRFPLAAMGAAVAGDLRTEVTDLLERHQRLAALYPRRPDGSRRLAFADHGITVEGELAGLRADASGSPCLLRTRPGRLQAGKAAAWRCDALVHPWVTHLLANAGGLPLTTWLVGIDAELCLPPLSPEACAGHLRTLLRAWREGQRRPLPLASQTAFAWLDAEAAGKDPEDAARRAYEGSGHHVGELGRSPYHARTYPGADALLQADGFIAWTDLLYRPLHQMLEQRGEAQA
jgi:exodeoxyribonuclease V gamma subunit